MRTFQCLIPFCKEFEEVVLQRTQSCWEVFTLQPSKGSVAAQIWSSAPTTELHFWAEGKPAEMQKSFCLRVYCLPLTLSAVLLLIKSPGHQTESAGNQTAGKSNDASIKSRNFVPSNNWTMKDLSHFEVKPGTFKISANVGWGKGDIPKHSASNFYFHTTKYSTDKMPA